ncbi:IS66 family insertion sequence element accessory protein TnpB [Aerococcaceae bacterium zg-BR9]|uniref:IS66 family insertion sequence element accessory protein TnpB n=1 Tax=Aerococcaceae bacterium zg-1292 TaxID=2774330 RepID=UPI004063A122|nr:IS66 family insertion sequence element accessory protein TnpB [Aerococcaceae bacterium zg-BR9]
MALNLTDLGQVYLVCGKTDMRQGIDSLAIIVKEQLALDPFSGSVFLFCGTKKDRFKALYWDGQGFWLLYKRFGNGRLQWPNTVDQVEQLSNQQIEWLMSGFSIYPKINTATQRDFY